MTVSIFYSWQSDSPSAVNRNFIEDVLRKAIKLLKSDVKLLSSMRDADVALDKDTSGLPGTPPIVQSIFDKIDKCSVFVPDLSFVARTDEGRPVPNPNVLIEYGWALKSRGAARILPVMNSAFGEPSGETLPFNMRHLRWPLTYDLPDIQQRSAVRDRFVPALTEAMRTILQLDTAERSIREGFEETESSYDKAVYFQSDEILARWEGRLGLHSDLRFNDTGARMYLRLIPTSRQKLLDAKEIRDLAWTKETTLQSFNFVPVVGGERRGRNKYGPIAYLTGSQHTDPIDALTQLFKNRELWGVNGEPGNWQHNEKDFKFLANGYERAFVLTLAHYLKFSRDNLSLQLPIRVIAGFTGIERFKMAAPGNRYFGGYEKFHGNAVEPDITFETTVNDWESPPDQLLKPFFEKIWHEFGFDERPDVPN